MKQLKEYIKEGLFDGIDDIENTDGLDNATKGFEQLDKEKIFDYIYGHYFLVTNDFRKTVPLNKSQLEIDLKTNPPTVNCKGSLVFHSEDSTLTNNGMFQWGSVSGGFRCAYRKSLASLKGSPKEIGGIFDCSNCNLLKSLEGAPKKIGRRFDCSSCNLLTSLKGAPKEVIGDFDCSYCKSLKSLEGTPKEVGGFFCYYCNSLTSLKGAPKEVIGDFDCSYCKSLKSLKDAPEEVGGDFSCINCGTQFTETDVKKVSNIKKGIFCRQW